MENCEYQTAGCQSGPDLSVHQDLELAAAARGAEMVRGRSCVKGLLSVCDQIRGIGIPAVLASLSGPFGSGKSTVIAEAVKLVRSVGSETVDIVGVDSVRGSECGKVVLGMFSRNRLYEQREWQRITDLIFTGVEDPVEKMFLYELYTRSQIKLKTAEDFRAFWFSMAVAVRELAIFSQIATDNFNKRGKFHIVLLDRSIDDTRVLEGIKGASFRVIEEVAKVLSELKVERFSYLGTVVEQGFIYDVHPREGLRRDRAKDGLAAYPNWQTYEFRDVASLAYRKLANSTGGRGYVLIDTTFPSRSRMIEEGAIQHHVELLLTSISAKLESVIPGAKDFIEDENDRIEEFWRRNQEYVYLRDKLPFLPSFVLGSIMFPLMLRRARFGLPYV